jgi:thiamine biosynthesis lipoprotein
MLVTAFVNLGGGDARITVEEAHLPMIREEAERLDSIFSFYDPQGELHRLNHDRRIVPGPELRAVIATALRYCELTGGRYDITHGKLFVAQKSRLALPVIGCSWRDVVFQDDEIVLKHPDAMIDLGSIAKGYIIDHLAARVPSVFIDAHGDGKSKGVVQTVKVGPRSLRIKDVAFATSRDSLPYAHNGTRHIVGMTDVRTATVLAPTAIEADALSTALYLCGGHCAIDILKTMPGAHALLQMVDGREIIIGDVPLDETRA